MGKPIIGYQKNICGHCQGTGVTSRAIYESPPRIPHRVMSKIKEQSIKYSQRYSWDHSPAWVIRQMYFSKYLLGELTPYSNDAARRCAKLAWTLASLLIAEKYGWTPEMETQVGKRFKWYQKEGRKHVHKK